MSLLTSVSRRELRTASVSAIKIKLFVDSRLEPRCSEKACYTIETSRYHALPKLRADGESRQRSILLICSVSVIVATFGWFRA